ncbi:MAG: DUF4870 domain-containing protein [Verrucomicrobiota bacterium]
MDEETTPKEEQAGREQAETSEELQDQAPGQPDAKEPESSEPDEDIEKVKNVAAAAYVIFFLPLLTNPESRFGKFHANQALLLLLTCIVINLVGGIIPIIGWFLIIPLGMIFVLVLLVKGIINAVNGKTERLPLIGGYDIIK